MAGHDRSGGTPLVPRRAGPRQRPRPRSRKPRAVCPGRDVRSSVAGFRERSPLPAPIPPKRSADHLSPRPPPARRPRTRLRSARRWPTYRSPSVEMTAIVIADDLVGRACGSKPTRRVVLLDPAKGGHRVDMPSAFGWLEAIKLTANGIVHHLGKPFSGELCEATDLVHGGSVFDAQAHGIHLSRRLDIGWRRYFGNGRQKGCGLKDPPCPPAPATSPRLPPTSPASNAR